MEPRQLRAAIILGSLALAATAIIVAAIAFTGRPEVPETEPPPPTGDIETPDRAGSEEPSDGGPGSSLDEPDEAPEAATVELGFDGVCTVVAAQDELAEDPQPWHFDECTSAPIELADRDDVRWIVVLASLSGADLDEAAARDRAAELGFDEQLLWSTHYPSLNPGFWVVYEGPFEDRDAAGAAADGFGDPAYARRLTLDPSER